jgi:hypothetical protein
MAPLYPQRVPLDAPFRMLPLISWRAILDVENDGRKSWSTDLKLISCCLRVRWIVEFRNNEVKGIELERSTTFDRSAHVTGIC